jgi:hypothetical protein
MCSSLETTWWLNGLDDVVWVKNGWMEVESWCIGEALSSIVLKARCHVPLRYIPCPWI